MEATDQTPVSPDVPPPPPESLVVVAFNTGSGPELRHDDPPDDGYSSAHAEITDTWYGNGLAFELRIEETATFFDALDPDIVTFQELFSTTECGEIPAEFHPGFICDGWAPGDPSVADRILGAEYEVQCNPGKPDKCLAVHQRVGTISEVDGFKVEGCGGGARIARYTITRPDGEVLTVVNVHGSSGFKADDFDCRVRQFDQIFVDLGDGEPGANGARNLVLGDLNTDPGRAAGLDISAARWNEHVSGDPFYFLSDVGEDAEPTYATLFNIDHAVTDFYQGSCTSPVVTEATFFDHRPLVCTITAPAQ